MAKSAVRFRDSVAQFERLSADIAARRFAPVLLLMGDESYFIDALCDRLASTISAKPNGRSTRSSSTGATRSRGRSSTSAARCR